MLVAAFVLILVGASPASKAEAQDDRCLSPYRCADGTCLPDAWHCDGDDDCGDNSDEEGCDTPPPPSSTTPSSIEECFGGAEDFRCTSGKCVLVTWRCDGEDDCGDNSDEEGCTVPTATPPTPPTITSTTPSSTSTTTTTDAPSPGSDAGQTTWQCAGDSSEKISQDFRCASGKCVLLSWRCDGADDCGDNSDEEGCPVLTTTTTTPPSASPTTPATSTTASIISREDDNSITCSEGWFACGLYCLHPSKLCDGVGDCVDSSDEAGCDEIGSSSSSSSSTANPTPTPEQATSGSSSDAQDGSSSSVCDAEIEFQCLDLSGATNCIHWSWRCDGDPDCDDKSDEHGCPVPTDDSDEDLVSTTASPSPGSGSSTTSPSSGSDSSTSSPSLGSDPSTSSPSPGSDPSTSSLSLGSDPTTSAEAVSPTARSAALHACSDTQFACHSGECFPASWRCDGVEDCIDDSDELDCDVTTTTTIVTATVTATTDPTISSSSPSSESPKPTPATATCSGTQFLCDDVCMTLSWRCDGDYDCNDHADELDCDNGTDAGLSQSQSCFGEEFQCANGNCIHEAWRCDGENDCTDNSDEINCPTTTAATTTTTTTTTSPAATATAATKVKEEVLQLLVSSLRGVSLYRPDTDTTTPLVRSVGQARYVDVDYHHGQQFVFWTEVSSNKVQRMSLSDNSSMTVVAYSPNANGLAVDWVHDNLYWTDETLRTVRVARLDGTFPRSLLYTDIEKPRAIAVHPGRREFFWSDWGSVAKIERCSLSGLHRKVLVNTTIGWPNGLTIDYSGERLYWVDGRLKEIRSVDYEGQGLTVVVKESGHGFGISAFRNFVYWTDWTAQQIHRVPSNVSLSGTKSHSAVPMSLNFSETQPMGLAVFHPERQIQYENACGSNNGGCDHLCLPHSQLAFRCLCADGFLLSENMKTCIPGTPINQGSPPASTDASTAMTTAPQKGISIISNKSSDSLFYMVLMGIKAHSKAEAISMFEKLKDAASRASNNTFAELQAAN